MVKRKLDDQEIEFTKKGIERVRTEIKSLEEQMHFNKLTMDFQEATIKYQEIARPYLKRKKEQEDKKVMDTLKEQLARNRDTLENLEDQLIHGVTIKSIKPIKEDKNGN